ncbi:MAG TPA: DUF4153 domain-containing protein [Pyrinomonadaceae bacterium]|nr:DUF4153 domain-containing protein [Pyrinomonadaceae bacterium]
MINKSKIGFEILLMAAAMGIAGNLLLRHTPWGVGASVFVAGFAACVLYFSHKRRAELFTPINLAFTAAIIFFGSMFSLRDSFELKLFDTAAIIFSMGAIILSNFWIKQRAAGVLHYIAGVLIAGFSSLFGPFVLLGNDLDWKSTAHGQLARGLFAVARGILVAVPLLLIFGALFISADSDFESWVNRLIWFDLDNAISHLVISFTLAWLCAGYFRGFAVPLFTGYKPAGYAGKNQEQEGQQPAPAKGGASSNLKQECGIGEVSIRSDKTFVSETSESTASGSFQPGSVSILESLQGDDAAIYRNAENASLIERIQNEDPAEMRPDGQQFQNHQDQQNQMQGASGSQQLENESALQKTSAGKQGDSEQSPQTLTKVRGLSWQNIENSFLPSFFKFGTSELIVILGALNLLFLSFVAFQVPYLFGGLELVQNTEGLKLSEYARRGFGELVVVAGLVLPFLLITEWLIDKENKKARLIFRFLAGLQISLLFVIMASALQRLFLITGELGYGMTTVRFYPMVFIFWLGIVFLWFCLTVLRGKRNNFAGGAVLSGLLVLAYLNILNPDDYIARTNLALMQKGRPFDAAYNARLSGDAVNALVENFEILSDENKCEVSQIFLKKLESYKENNDIRSWNLGRMRSQNVLTENLERLKAANCCNDCSPIGH